MGMQRLAPAFGAARRLRCLFVGSSVSQTGLEYGKISWARCQSPVETGTSTVKVLKFPVHRNGSLCREYKCKAMSQIETVGVALHSTFSQSAFQSAQQSIDDTSGRRKKKMISAMARQNLKTQKRPIVFECWECEAICVTQILKDPYDRGVVIVRCMDCRSVNLISDQLNLFKEPGSVQKFLREKGVDVRNGPERSYELTPEQLAEMEQQSSIA